MADNRTPRRARTPGRVAGGQQARRTAKVAGLRTRRPNSAAPEGPTVRTEPPEPEPAPVRPSPFPRTTVENAAPDAVVAPATGERDNATGAESAEPGVAESAEDADSETLDATEKPAGRRITRFGAVVLVLGVLVLVAGTGTAYLALRGKPAGVQPAVAADGGYTPGTIPSAAGAAAVATAAHDLPTVLSYDYRSLAADENASAKLMTAAFGTTFRKTFDTTVKPMATGQHAVTRSLVRGAGLINLGDDRQASCLLYVDELLVSGGNATPQKPAQVSQNRVVVTMKYQGNAWLIDNIEPF
jgi:hypothetical protein